MAPRHIQRQRLSILVDSDDLIGVHFQVMILITGAHKALALNKAIEEGVSHMWTVSAFQMHPRTIFVCDEDATLELKVKTVKYFKGLMSLHNKLVEEEGDPPFVHA